MCLYISVSGESIVSSACLKASQFIFLPRFRRGKKKLIVDFKNNKKGEKNMKHFVLHTIIQLSVLYRAEEEVRDGLKALVTKDEATEKCAEKGYSLFRYSDIQANSLDSQLEDGESAWIEGYAVYSPFLAWKGCFKRTVVAGLTSFDMGRHDLYSCITDCLSSQPEILRIAVQNTSCFCITSLTANSLRTYLYGDLFCRIRCSRKAFDYCGGDDVISIYRFVADREMNLAQIKRSHLQCVTATKKNNRFELSTASCYASRMDGYLCKTNDPSAKCDKWDNSTQYCLVQRETTRHEAFSDCLNKSGLLIDLHGEIRSLPLMTDGLKYWIGLYRTFKTTETSSGNDTVCLAVRKYKDELFLEPDGCRSEKKYLCRTGRHSSISNSVSVTDNPITQGKQQTQVTDSYKNTSINNGESTVSFPSGKPESNISSVIGQMLSTTGPDIHVPFIVLYSLISILIFTIFLAVFIIICIYKKSRTQKSVELASQRHTENNVHEEVSPFRKDVFKVKSDVERLPKTLTNNGEDDFVEKSDLQGEVQGDTGVYVEINSHESKLMSENTHDKYNLYDECGIKMSDCNNRSGWRKSLDYYNLEDL